MAERAGEHREDAVKFREKSHIVKHWMTDHPEENKAPPFTFKVMKIYKDCLSRQVGEAIAILLSKDHLLNSKNEYLTNCIHRITVDEDLFDRRTREIRELEAEKEKKLALETFKNEKEGINKRSSQMEENDQLDREKYKTQYKTQNGKNVPEGWSPVCMKRKCPDCSVQ